MNHYYHRMVPMVRTLQRGTQAWQHPSTDGRMKAASIITTHPLVSARQRVISRNSYGKQQPKWAAPLRVVTVRCFPVPAVMIAPNSGTLSASTHRPETLLVIITSTSKRMCNDQFNVYYAIGKSRSLSALACWFHCFCDLTMLQWNLLRREYWEVCQFRQVDTCIFQCWPLRNLENR